MLAVVVAVGLSIADAKVFQTRENAIATLFLNTTSVRKELFLTKAQVTAIAESARSEYHSRRIVYYEIMESDELKARVFIDTCVVRIMPETVLIAVSPTASIQVVKILAFHEVPEYLVPEYWLAQFKNRILNDGLWLKQDVDAIAGATLTSRATLGAVRRALAVDKYITAK